MTKPNTVEPNPSKPNLDILNKTMWYQTKHRESLVSDIPAWDGNVANLFFSVGYQTKS